MSTAQTEAIWAAADSLLCPDTAAVVVNERSPFGYLASGRYATVASARKAARRCVVKPEYSGTFIVTRGRGDGLNITAVA